MSYNGAAAVNVPIAPDKAAVRVSGFYSQDGGYIDNLALGQEDVNSSDIYGGRADLLLMPIDGLSIRVAGFFQNISRDGMGVADFTYAGSPIDGSLEQRRLVAEPFEQRFRSISGTVSYEMDWATLTSISSYQTAETEIMFDLSPLWVPIAAGLGRTYSAMGYFNAIDMKRFVQEMRLASGGAQRLEWLIGGFYSDESSPFVQGFIPFDLGGRPVPNDLFSPSGRCGARSPRAAGW